MLNFVSVSSGNLCNGITITGKNVGSKKDFNIAGDISFFIFTNVLTRT